MELRMKKKLLEQQIAVLDSKAGKISNVLEKKRASKVRAKRNNLSSQQTAEPKLTTITQNYSNQDLKFQNSNRSSISMLNPSCSEPDLMIQPRTIKGGTTADRVRKKYLMQQTQSNLTREQKIAAGGPKPPKAGAFRRREVPDSLFPVRYNRGELPCSIEHRSAGYALTWICPLQTLDYEHYLPMFFDGIRVKEEPFKFMAKQGVIELLEASKGYPERILPCLPEITKSLRIALNTRDPEIILTSLHCLQGVVECNAGIGKAMIPFYRQLLSIMNLFLTKRQNIGDTMDFGQRKGEDINAEIIKTLETLEQEGGPDAFVNIKYMVPTYESCLI